MYSRAYVEPSETLSDCLFADEDEECSDVDVDIEGVNISCAPSHGFKDLGDLLPEQDVRCLLIGVHLFMVVTCSITGPCLTQKILTE
jgi:hypothetical protein